MGRLHHTGSGGREGLFTAEPSGAGSAVRANVRGPSSCSFSFSGVDTGVAKAGFTLEASCVVALASLSKQTATWKRRRKPNFLLSQHAKSYVCVCVSRLWAVCSNSRLATRVTQTETCTQTCSESRQHVGCVTFCESPCLRIFRWIPTKLRQFAPAV